MKIRSTRRLAWPLWGLTMALEGAAIWLWLGNQALGGEYSGPQIFIVPGYATVGAIIAERRGNKVGWLFVGLALVAALQALSGVYGERVTLIAPESLPAGSLAQVLGNLLWPVNYVFLGLLLLLFPDGRLPSPRWRPAATLIIGSWCLLITLDVFYRSHDNPLFVPALQPVLKPLIEVMSPAAVVGLAVMVAAPFVRFRRAGYQQRQQLKWVAFIALLSMITVFAAIGLSRVLPAARLLSAALGVLGALGIAVGIPVAVAIAILRHRLYDIDRLINRTLVYGVLTTILGLSYASAVLVLGEVFGGMGAEPPSWAVAGATLAVAAVFRPARRRIQAAVDRRFNRRKYDVAKTIETFSARLRDELDPDALVAEIVAVVDHTMEPSARSLWLRSHTRR